MTQIIQHTGHLTHFIPAQGTLDTHVPAGTLDQVMGARKMTRRASSSRTSIAKPMSQVGTAAQKAAPYFSVLIPCLNAADTLADTLNSVAAQSHQNWEAILIDLGSTDGTMQIAHARAQNDPRFRVITLAEATAQTAYNHAAIRLARGEIIAFCAAGDIWSHDKLWQLHRLYRMSNTDAAYARVAYGDAQDTKVTRLSRVAAGPLTRTDILLGNPIGTVSNLSIRRSVFIRAEGFAKTDTPARFQGLVLRVLGLNCDIRGLNALQVHTLLSCPAAPTPIKHHRPITDRPAARGAALMADRPASFDLNRADCASMRGNKPLPSITSADPALA